MVLGRLGAATPRHTDGPQIRPRHVRDEPGKYGDAGLRGQPDRHALNVAILESRDEEHMGTALGLAARTRNLRCRCGGIAVRRQHALAMGDVTIGQVGAGGW